MGTFFSLLLLFLIIANESLAKKQCELITIPMCKGIGYNQTSYPNSYGHEKQEEAGLEVHQFYPLVEVNCYKHLKFFLCAMYTPICQDNYELSIMPCREVCVEAKKLCSPLMNQHGFKWPDTLQCDQLPKHSDQQETGTICAAPPDATKMDSMEEEEPKPDLSKNRINNNEWHVNEEKRRCNCECTAPFRLVSSENAAINLYKVQNVSNCAHACNGLLMPPTRAEQGFMQNWMLILAVTCFSLSFFTVVTFCIDMSRFPYPERPIMFLAFCQCAVSLGFIIQLMQPKGSKVGCDGDILRTMLNADLLTGSSSTLGCLGVFALIYYFGMAAAIWWVVLSLSWVLAAVPHWSNEWIAKYSFYFHAFSWILPAIQTALAYLFGAIDGDPITGVCYIGNTNSNNLLFFVIGPITLYFLAGLLFLFTGFRNLWSIRSDLKKSHPRIDRTSKLTQLISKIGFFSFIYSASVILHLAILLIEYYFRPLWEQSYLCPCSTYQPPNNETLYIMSLLKMASMLVVGWFSIIWILSPKTLQSWKRLFCLGSSPYATYTGPPFGDHIVGPQYSKIPQPPQFPPPIIKHQQFSPIDMYKQHEIMSSPMTYKSGAGTLRGFYPENV